MDQTKLNRPSNQHVFHISHSNICHIFHVFGLRLHPREQVDGIGCVHLALAVLGPPDAVDYAAASDQSSDPNLSCLGPIAKDADLGRPCRRQRNRTLATLFRCRVMLVYIYIYILEYGLHTLFLISVLKLHFPFFLGGGLGKSIRGRECNRCLQI